MNKHSASLEAQRPLETPVPDPESGEVALPYYARPKGDEKFYTWEGREYVRVTHMLEQVPGPHLMAWYGKQAALKAASCLFSAGVLPSDEELFKDDVLQDFCRGRDPLTKEEAVNEIYRWSMVMREAERYRDHKARIGSIVHHWSYAYALGAAETRLPRGEWIDYLRWIAIDLKAGLWHSQYLKNPGFEPTEEMVMELARMAEPYVLSRWEWIQKAQPEWEAIGLEAVVIHEELGVAGTCDEWYRLKRSVVEKNFIESEFAWHWPGKTEIRVLDDMKTSNALPPYVQVQCTAYSRGDYVGIMQTGARYPIGEFDAIGCCHIGPHPSMAGIEDEYGALQTKAKQLGCKLWTWDPSDLAWEAFVGLVGWYRFLTNRPKPHQYKARAKAQAQPAPAPTKYEPRACPF